MVHYLNLLLKRNIKNRPLSSNTSVITENSKVRNPNSNNKPKLKDKDSIILYQ